ncbi:MAG: hypothetical protein ACRDU8_02950 [Egibacteraceae bacterium]
MKLAHHGLSADLPRGWDGRIFRRAQEEEGGTSNPILHAATVPLPQDRGDFGSGVVDLLGDDDVFVALVEYDPEAAATALFRRQGVPRRLAASLFGPNRLQRAIPGQSGTQVFFTEGGRAYCLYVVLGSGANRGALLGKVHQLLGSLHIERGGRS